eukprot:2434931-Pyramimonas_sp.AAC.1
MPLGQENPGELEQTPAATDSRHRPPPMNRGTRLRDHDPREGRADMARGRHANPVTEAFGGAPRGATILVR